MLSNLILQIWLAGFVVLSFFSVASASAAAMPRPAEVKIINIDGIEYIARPNVPLKFCPTIGLSGLTTWVFEYNCLHQLRESPTEAEIASCFKQPLLATQHFDEMLLIGLSDSCLESMFQSCIEIKEDVFTHDPGKRTGILGSYLSLIYNEKIDQTLFSADDGIDICRKIFLHN